MNWQNLDELKAKCKQDGFEGKAVLSDVDMAKAIRLVAEDPCVVTTPDEGLRYLEGLLELPFGHIRDFRVVPADGQQKCACGRTHTALDVVHHALSKNVHDKKLIRDTMIGFSNVFEAAGPGGRGAECYACGRTWRASRYSYKGSYLYA